MSMIETVTTNAKTVGLSPKVYIPTLAEALAGVVLVIMGLDKEGFSLLAAAAGTFGIGFGSSPGKIEITAESVGNTPAAR